MNTKKIKKLLILSLPYVILGLICTNIGEAWRLAEGADYSKKLVSFFSMVGVAFGNPMPSFHPLDLFIGAICGGGLRLAVYLRGKNAKHYKHNEEYGSARWGGPKDIEPFMDTVFENNVILTRTERLMMGNRPKNPAHARNKNVLIIGGSGSGKTRFWIKPNLLQLHSSYVLTDPKGTTLLEVGNAFVHAGYRIKIFNTINFKKSMHYNPFAYIHSEKDILKLTTTLMANTKGDGKGGDPFWDKAETLLYCALIGYIIGNCDTQIFLGGSEPSTLKDLAEALGKETIDTFNTSDTRGNSPSYGTNYQKLGKELMSRDELAVLEGSKCILQLRGVRPFLSDKYDLTQHPNFKYTADSDKKLTFDIEKFLDTKAKLKASDEFLVVEA